MPKWKMRLGFACSFTLLYKFGWLALKPFLALQAAEMDGFAFIGYFELSCVFV
jgi:hypothetical protein